jgi:hypothetical protein
VLIFDFLRLFRQISNLLFECSQFALVFNDLQISCLQLVCQHLMLLFQLPDFDLSVVCLPDSNVL